MYAKKGIARARLLLYLSVLINAAALLAAYFYIQILNTDANSLLIPDLIDAITLDYGYYDARVERKCRFTVTSRNKDVNRCISDYLNRRLAVNPYATIAASGTIKVQNNKNIVRLLMLDEYYYISNDETGKKYYLFDGGALRAYLMRVNETKEDLGDIEISFSSIPK